MNLNMRVIGWAIVAGSLPQDFGTGWQHFAILFGLLLMTLRSPSRSSEGEAVANE